MVDLRLNMKVNLKVHFTEGTLHGVLKVAHEGEP